MEKITLSIFVPCFNEEKNIVNTLNNIKNGVVDMNYEILVVDDASKDETIKMIEKFKENNPSLDIKIISNKTNRGIGFNYRETAQKAQGEYYMFLCGDDSLPSTEIKKTVDNIGKADMILVYFNDKRGFLRKILSKIFVIIINLITVNNLKYYNGSNIHLLENVKFFCGRQYGFGYQAELITSQIRSKKTYVEIEVKPYLKTYEKSEALKLRSVASVIKSIIIIFLKQIIYVVKKILNIK
jgi:glycosyltransferase involved in cell wall biosynthesis